MQKNITCNHSKEILKLTKLITKLRDENKVLKARVRHLERKDEWLIVEQAAEIIGVLSCVVSALCDRYGLKFKMAGSRRLYTRRNIEKLRDEFNATRQAGTQVHYVRESANQNSEIKLQVW